MAGLKLVRLQHLALKYALQRSIVEHQMFVNMESFKSIQESTYILVVILVLCAVMSDCFTVTGFTTCKELATTGPPTCQPVSACQSSCSDGDYCSSDDICKKTGEALQK